MHPLWVPLDGELGISNVCMSMPCILGREGVARRLEPALDGSEVDALRASAEALRRAESDAGLA